MARLQEITPLVSGTVSRAIIMKRDQRLFPNRRGVVLSREKGFATEQFGNLTSAARRELLSTRHGSCHSISFKGEKIITANRRQDLKKIDGNVVAEEGNKVQGGGGGIQVEKPYE